MSESPAPPRKEFILLVHTHRCQIIQLTVHAAPVQPSVIALKKQIEAAVGLGALFRMTGRPVPEQEFKLVYHGQVMEDYDLVAMQNLASVEEWKRRLNEKQAARRVLQCQLGLPLTDDGPADAELSTDASVAAAFYKSLRLQLQQLPRSELSQNMLLHEELSRVLKEEEDMGQQVRKLEQRCHSQSISNYYIGKGSMVHICPAKAKLSIYSVRINYTGETVQTTHWRCESIAAIIAGLRRKRPQLPKSSADFSVGDALFWRCNKSKLLRLDPCKCLCEYDIPEGSEFEHDIEKEPVSRLARKQAGGISRTPSKLRADRMTHLCAAYSPHRANHRGKGVHSSATSEALPEDFSSDGVAQVAASLPALVHEVVPSPCGKLQTHRFKRSIVEREAANAKKAAATAQGKVEEAETRMHRAEALASQLLAGQRVAEARQRAAEGDLVAAQHARRSLARALVEAQEIRREVVLSPTNEVPMCTICAGVPAEVAVVPCGHRCYCVECSTAAREFFSSRAASRNDDTMTTCPVCRTAATDFIRIY
eukprot:gnl/TRDRNA2_/TRDRNA2_192592_c0_seq1.p1 gnl/TRDRNA2_/TRDRNA2_192592_c0~~gnl/TRDRNA2_/TRDRNA2_192592_c0_seq1.p1  ORF type:complete len:537 (+),score=118.37 gnl/TRDRNA2_/TRDRNA2_192592_c0_seq1:67-1677(+)